MNKSTKQVIIIRRDLKSRRGKEIAQGSHASMAFLTKDVNIMSDGPKFYIDKTITEAQKEWLESSFRKITCCVESESELVALHEKALAAGLESHLITDNGLTEFGGVPTKTAVAIGPDYDDLIDPITKDLKLY